MDELKAKVREGLESQLKRDMEKQYKGQLVKHLVEAHAFDIPPSLLKEEMALALQHIQHDHGQTDTGQTHEHKDHDNPEQQEKLQALQANIQETANTQVKARLILDAIAKQQGFTLSNAEVEKEYGRLAEQMKVSISEVKRKLYAGGDREVQRLKARLLHQKSLQHVYENANIHD